VKILMRFGLFSTIALLALSTSGCALLGSHRPDYVEPTTGMEFRIVPGGTFIMGDTTGTGNKRELPAHEVTISPFYVGIYEVTFAQYDIFCAATDCEGPSDSEWGREHRPVINVSWHDAMAFADWLSKKSGYKFTLPSESQWEYFAQTGTAKNTWTSSSPKNNRANCNGCGSPWDYVGTAPVGTFPPNPQGLYDTAGNVSEWCLDTVHQSYVGAPANGQPWIDANENRRIHRGGNWSFDPQDLDPFVRDYAEEDFSGNYLGFRLIVEGPPLPPK